MKFGLISSPVPGHIHPMSTVGRELLKRGHETFFFNIEDIRAKITSEGHKFIPIGSDFPVGSWEKYWAPLSKEYGLGVVFKTIKLHTKLSKMMVREIPALAKELKLDAFLIDQVQFQGETIASLSGLPFISIACALHMDKDQNFHAPPPVSKRKYGENTLTRILNRIEWAVMEKVASPLVRSGNPHLKNADESFSKIAQIFPMPEGGDFPGNYPSECIHYVGSFIDQSRPQVPFDFEGLSDRPLIYASLGTLQNGMMEVYEKIAQACAGLDAQVILALGQWRETSTLPFLVPSNVKVVGYAPQIKLFERASLVITHAGMNTAYEALSFGLPMVAIPITNDQPAVARRLERVGAAEVVPIEKLSVKKLRAAIEKVLHQKSYKLSAEKMAQEIKVAGGVQRAADIIEQKLKEYYGKH